MKIMTLSLADSELKYELTRGKRLISIRLRVTNEGVIKVTAPFFVAENYLERFLLSRVDWIKEKLSQAARIKKIEVPKYLSESQIKTIAKKKILSTIREVNRNYNFSFNKVFFRDQKTRWGSCSSQGNLNFNYKIAFLPDHLAEYVITHELCHLREMNHSQDFWHLVSGTIPEYRLCRRELRLWRG